MATCYCPSCLNTFTGAPACCPNLGCRRELPSQGWGRILEAGELIDRHYRVDQVLALGGAGLTYLCRAVDSVGQPVPPELAVKVLFAERAAGGYLRRLANEAQLLQDLDHDHIVRCRGFVQRAGQPPYLVTLFEAGGTLQQHLRLVGPLPAPVAAGVTVQVLKALAMAHSAGVVHRDLKPANVLLHAPCAREATPWVRVADFGIAKVNAPIGAGLTQAGSFVGTPEYAAPEQHEGLPPLPATDIFAAGGLLFFLLTGQAPVQLQVRGDPLDCLERLLAQLPLCLPHDTLPPAEQASLQEILDHVSRPNPAERWSIPRIMEVLRPMARLPERPVASAPTPPMPEAAPAADLGGATLYGEPPPPTPAQPAAPPDPYGATLFQEPQPIAAELHPQDVTLEDLFTAPAVPPREMTLDDLFGAPAAPRPASSARPAVPVPAAAPARPAAGTWIPSAPLPLPSPLPSSVEALLSLLGAVAIADRIPLERALAALPRPELGRALRAWRPGQSAATGRGAGLAIAALGGADLAAIARNLLRAAEPEVRACACQALGATARGSLLSTLARALEDSSPPVRAAAAHALGEACARSGDQTLGASWLARIADDPEEEVRAAYVRALARLGA